MEIRNENSKKSLDELYTRAKEKVAQNGGKSNFDHDSLDIGKSFLELDVYYTEIEMQNDELRLAQERLEHTINKYADLYDFAPVGYFILDKNGLIVSVNMTGAYMLQKDRKLLIKKPMALLVTRNFKDKFRCFVNDIIKFHQPAEPVELEMQRKDKSVFFAQIKGSAIRSDDGDEQIRLSLQDISEKKKIEDEKIALAERISNFARQAKQELKSGILKNVEIMETRPEKTSELLPVIKSQIESLLASVEELI